MNRPCQPSEGLIARCMGETPDDTLDLLGPLCEHMRITPATGPCTKNEAFYGRTFFDVSADELRTLMGHAEGHGYGVRIGVRYVTLERHAKTPKAEGLP